jgi:hypothetical protein
MSNYSQEFFDLAKRSAAKALAFAADLLTILYIEQ